MAMRSGTPRPVRWSSGTFRRRLSEPVVVRECPVWTDANRQSKVSDKRRALCHPGMHSSALAPLRAGLFRGRTRLTRSSQRCRPSPSPRLRGERNRCAESTGLLDGGLQRIESRNYITDFEESAVDGHIVLAHGTVVQACGRIANKRRAPEVS